MSEKITPYLWYADNAEDAVNLYVSIFDNSRIVSTSRFGEDGPMPAGTLMAATFELDGREFTAFNAGPHEPFTDAISLFVSCDSQAEIDRYWDAFLTNGGTPTQCGWLKDRFGVSWQIVPAVLTQYLSDPDPDKAQRTAAAMMSMVKLDLAELTAAYHG